MTAWIGTEKEGKCKGIKTLFIKGDVNKKDIQNLLKQYKGIHQLYFGAGMCSKVNFDIVNYFKENTNLIITVELLFTKLSSVIHLIKHDINLILTINNKSIHLLNRNNIQIKIQDVEKEILLISPINNFDSVDITTLENKKYKDDVIVL